MYSLALSNPKFQRHAAGVRFLTRIFERRERHRDIGIPATRVVSCEVWSGTSAALNVAQNECLLAQIPHARNLRSSSDIESRLLMLPIYVRQSFASSTTAASFIPAAVGSFLRINRLKLRDGSGEQRLGILAAFGYAKVSTVWQMTAPTDGCAYRDAGSLLVVNPQTISNKGPFLTNLDFEQSESAEISPRRPHADVRLVGLAT
ncbi:hypothetical protein BC567DRAFT_209815 [Phyllosticta citribraziliensis]